MSAASPQTVVVLGAGVGGQVAATRLKQRLGARARVVVVERSPAFTFAPSLLWLMVGQRRAATITTDFSTLSKRGSMPRYSPIRARDAAVSTGPTSFNTSRAMGVFS